MTGSSRSRQTDLIQALTHPVRHRYSLKALFDREPEAKGKLWRRYQKTNVLLIGAGGLGGFLGLGLARKAIRRLTICDGDIVELSNLARQRFYFTDMGKPKATSLARNLRPEIIARTEIEGIGLYFEEALEEGLISPPDLCICMPDNDEARALAAAYCYQRGIPLVVGALSHDSDYGYLFVQPSSKGPACWGCFRTGATGRIKCGAKANINLPMIFAGLALSVCDDLISGLDLGWNFRRFCISGVIPDIKATISKSEQCLICGKTGAPGDDLHLRTAESGTELSKSLRKAPGGITNQVALGNEIGRNQILQIKGDR